MKTLLKISLPLHLASLMAVGASVNLDQHSIGEPTAKEQLYVELINRARANPTAEGIFLDSLKNSSEYPNIAAAYSQFGVNLTIMKREFVTGSAAGLPTLNVQPPLAISKQLTAAARAHSQDQIDHDFQGHETGNNPSGASGGDRIAAQGYSYSAWGENTYAASFDVLFGHAGFQVDWGGDDGTGMQGPPRGHRSSIHSSSYREIGVGNLTAAETTIPSGNRIAVGPEICTQNFARQSNSTPFITGVAYYDLNGNNFYDIGEGLGGITVTVSGTSKFAVTSQSGGYAIPMPGNGNYTVTFAPSFSDSPISYDVTISNNENLKQDLILTYSAPATSGPTEISQGDVNTYHIENIPGATSFSWNWGLVDSLPVTEDADQGTSDYSTSIVGNYDTVQSAVSYSGNAFRLFGTSHQSAGFGDQILTLDRIFTPGAAASIHFKSRLSWQSSNQRAKVQFSEDGGNTWIDSDFNQAGPNSAGESTFQDRTADISASVGKSVMIRFILSYTGGSLYTINPSSSTVAGWYIDDITFSDIEEVSAVTEETIASGNSFVFSPSLAGTYRLSARANLSSLSLAYGPSIDVKVSVGDPIVLNDLNINSGSSITESRTVTLNHSTSGAVPSHYMASEKPDLTGAELKVYTSSPTFELSPGSGDKVVYLKLMNGDGASLSKSDTITYLPPAPDSSIARPEEEAASPSSAASTVITSGTSKYSGFLSSSDGSEILGYFKSIKVSKKGKLSAKMYFGNVSYSLKGLFDENGQYSAVVTSKKGGPATVLLQLVKTSTGGYKVDGTVTVGTDTATVTAVKSGPTAAQAGVYTLLILGEEDDTSAPQGHGYGLMTVTSAGTAKIKGLLGDGSKWSAKCYLTSDGEMPLYAALYKKTGSIGGLVRFRNVEGVSDCDAEVHWHNPAGFSLQRSLVGSRYRYTGARLISSSSVQALVRNSLAIDLDWSSANKISYEGPDKVKVKVSTKNGQIKGSVSNSDGKFKMEGVIFQKQDLGAGLFYIKRGPVSSLIVVPKE